MTDQNKQPEKKPELSKSQKLFKDVMPWFGLVLLGVCSYYLLVEERDIPWYIIGICGVLMGLGRELVALKDLKP